MFGKKSKALRKEYGLTQKDCADITGHSQSSISVYEKSEYPNAEYIALLCEHINMPLYKFWLKEDEEKDPLPPYIKPEQAEILKLINTEFDAETRIEIWELFKKALEGFAVASGLKIEK